MRSHRPARHLHQHARRSELYRRKVAGLRAVLNAPDLRTEAITILRGLIERIVIRPGERAPEIELVGAIAAMVELAMGAQSNKAARGGRPWVHSNSVG